MKFHEKVIVGTAMTLLVVIATSIVFGGLFFSITGFFALIGVTYESIGSLLLFVFYCLLLGIAFEIIEMILLFFVARTNLQNREKWIWIAFVKLISTWIVIHIVNELMTTVVLSSLAEFLTALLIVSVDVVFDDKKKLKY